MNWNTIVREAFDGRPMPDHDIIDELAQHAALAYEAARADGDGVEVAQRRVRDLIRGWAAESALLERRPRRAAVVAPPRTDATRLAGFWADVRYAWQLLRRQWTQTAVVVATMALGIGASSVLFSVAYGVLVKPMPWPDAGRLVRVVETRQGSTRPPRFMTNLTFFAWTDKPATIDSLAAYASRRMTVTGSGAVQRIEVASVSPALLPMLGARVALGGLFDVDPARPVDRHQVVLGQQFWREHLSGRPDVVGQNIRLDGEVYRVAGVMASTIGFPTRETAAWVPFEVNHTPNGLQMFEAIARLKPGVTPEQAAAEATSRGRGAPDPGLVVVAVFGSKGPVQVTATPLVESMIGDVRPALVVFLIAVGLLLATAVANVASLQMARAVNRRREFAIRAALGAGGGRLARQLLVENTMLGVTGGGCGLLLGWWLVRGLPAVLPADFPRLADISLDWRIVVLSVGLSLMAGFIFGLAPALHAGRVRLAPALAEDGLAPVGSGTRTTTARMRLAIMTGQVAVATILLVGAAVLGRSFLALISADRGYDPSNVLTARLPLPEYAHTPLERAARLERLVARLTSVPGVTAAAASTGMPLTRGVSLMAISMRSPRDGTMVQAHASLRLVSPDYFTALRLRIRDGRAFTAADTSAAAPVLVVNRTFARQYLDDSPVGDRLPGESRPGQPEVTAEVVGVVDDVRQGSVTEAAVPEIYRCLLQLPDGLANEEPSLIVRTTEDPVALATTLRSIVHDEDPSIALESVMTMEERLVTSLARPRLYALLLGLFAVCALAIAGVGLFGVLSRGVVQRAREIGIRTALGATPGAVTWLVLRQGMAVTVGGLIIGLFASAALGKYVSKLLYGVTAYDPVSYLVVPAVLLADGPCGLCCPGQAGGGYRSRPRAQVGSGATRRTVPDCSELGRRHPPENSGGGEATSILGEPGTISLGSAGVSALGTIFALEPEENLSDRHSRSERLGL